MTAPTRRRFLRPAQIVCAEGQVWLLDRSQPAALVLDDAHDRVGRVVDWRAAPFSPVSGARRDVCANGAGLVMKSGRDQPVIFVPPDGDARWYDCAGLDLGDAGADVAYVFAGELSCAGGVVAAEDAASLSALGNGTLVAVSVDGRVRSMTVDRPVTGVECSPFGLMLTVVGEVVLTARGSGRYWLHHSQMAFRVDWDRLADPLAVAGLPVAQRAPAVWWQYRPGNDLEWIAEHGLPALGLCWSRMASGWADTPNAANAVIAVDPRTMQRVVHVGVGDGAVVALSAVGDEVWACLQHFDGPDVTGLSVVATDRAGELRTVVPTNSVDITEHCRP